MSLILPFDEWPKADKAIWAALLENGGPFDDRGALAHLRATSVATLQARYGRWLGWLSRAEPEALAEHPPLRATLPRLRKWLAALADTAPMSQLMFVDGLLRIMMASAPEADWSAQLRIKANLKRTAGRGDPERKQGRILSSRVLLDAGLRLAGPVADAIGNQLQRAEAQRNGTMVAFLAMMPIRCRAFTGLTLGESLIVRDDVLIVALPEDLTKTGVPWEAEVQEPVASALRLYLQDARPFLMGRRGQQHARLWVDRKGRPYRDHPLSVRVAETTLKLTGRRIPPHLFRDAAATTLVRESPDCARLVRSVLAHTGFETSERHYIQARTIEAGRDYAKLLKTLRGDR